LNASESSAHDALFHSWRFPRRLDHTSTGASQHARIDVAVFRLEQA
jgi:hypothetical protein